MPLRSWNNLLLDAQNNHKIHRIMKYLGQDIVDGEGCGQEFRFFPKPPLPSFLHDTEKFAIVGWVQVEHRMQGKSTAVFYELFRGCFEQRHVLIFRCRFSKASWDIWNMTSVSRGGLTSLF